MPIYQCHGGFFWTCNALSLFWITVHGFNNATGFPLFAHLPVRYLNLNQIGFHARGGLKSFSLDPFEIAVISSTIDISISIAANAIET